MIFVGVTHQTKACSNGNSLGLWCLIKMWVCLCHPVGGTGAGIGELCTFCLPFVLGPAWPQPTNTTIPSFREELGPFCSHSALSTHPGQERNHDCPWGSSNPLVASLEQRSHCGVIFPVHLCPCTHISHPDPPGEGLVAQSPVVALGSDTSEMI